jgi:hypothetical protein
MDALARKFHATHDMAVGDEIYRLAGEYSELKGAVGILTVGFSDPIPQAASPRHFVTEGYDFEYYRSTFG